MFNFYGARFEKYPRFRVKNVLWWFRISKSI